MCVSLKRGSSFETTFSNGINEITKKMDSLTKEVDVEKAIKE
jgi:hypothetical protein